MSENRSTSASVEAAHEQPGDSTPPPYATGKPDDCIRFGNPEHTNRYFKYEIRKPGHYCLTEDLHARLDMADHAAESTMITIWNTSNVVLDLQGHTLGRGRVFKNPGGVGIRIHNSTNVLVKNGVVQDFKVGVVRGPEYAMSSDVAESVQYDSQANTYRFPLSGIVLENMTFKNNKEDMLILVTKEMRP